MTNWTQIVKLICEAAVWIAFWGFAIHGCVQCHRIDADRQMQEKKP